MANLANQDDVSMFEVGGAREIRKLVPWTMRVGDADPQVRFIERRIVVTAVPDDDVSLLLSLGQDRPVIYASVDDDAVRDVGFVLFALLDRAVLILEIFIAGETLHRLGCEIAIRHGMANSHGLQTEIAQDVGNTS